MPTSNDRLPEFSDGPPIPNMCEAVLQNEDVENLFKDLATCTRILSVQEKGSEQEYANKGPHLQVARERLLDRNVRAMQIRYDYQDRQWTDTLMCVAGGFRLIRCQHPGD